MDDETGEIVKWQCVNRDKCEGHD